MSALPLRNSQRTPAEAPALRRWLACGLAAAACHPAAIDPPDAATSPQAKAEPAPLAVVSPGMTSAPSGGPDAGPAPQPFSADETLPADILREVVREPARDAGMRETWRDAHELAGLSIVGVIRTGEGPGAPRASEVNAPAIDAARRKTEARVSIDVVPARARFVFSGAFALPQGTELRARADRYGHLLFWPGESTYRVASPGALRALIGERRLDVSPLSAADVRLAGEGPRRLNLRTRRVEVVTRAARATLELASVGGIGEGGPLVCRFLLDLMSAVPGAPACTSDEVPVHAELRWTTRGSLTFEALSLARRGNLPAQELSAPPPSFALATDPPPFVAADTLLQRADLAAFRSAAVDVSPASPRDGQAPPPEAGLLLVNGSDQLRVVWIDGVPSAWLSPGARLVLSMMPRGRYVLQWRTFLGDGWEPAETLSVPGTSELGAR